MSVELLEIRVECDASRKFEFFKLSTISTTVTAVRAQVTNVTDGQTDRKVSQYPPMVTHHRSQKKLLDVEFVFGCML